MSIQQDVRSAWHEAIVELFELDLSVITGDASDVYYFTKEIFPDGTKVQWKGKIYEPFPIEISGFETSTKGTIPQPELTVANVLGTLASATNSLDDLVGAKITRRRTLGKYLDNGTSPDPSEEFPEDVYYIERKTSETNLTISWQLASKIDLEGLQLPRRVVTQNYCIWQYRGAECGYSGPPVAAEDDGPFQGDGSAESQNYINALNAFRAADNAVKQTQSALNLAQGRIISDCNPLTRPVRRTFSNLSGPNYSFGITNNGQPLFGAVGGNAVDVISAGADYRPTRTVRTNFGEDNNETGPVHEIQEVQLVQGVETVVAVYYSVSPQVSFALKLSSSSPSYVGIVNGGIVPIVQSGIGYRLGGQRASNIGKVTAIGLIDKSGALCASANAAYDTAEAAYNSAVASKTAAEAALNAATAALPAGSALFAQDICGKRLNSCKLRFGTTNLPFGGFPGANLSR